MESNPLFSTTRRVFLALSATLLLSLGNAMAGPREELHDAYDRFIDAHSFRAVMTDLDRGTITTRMEFAAPDSFRVTMPDDPTQLTIGSTIHMTIGDRTVKVPVPSGNLGEQIRDRGSIDAPARDAVVQAVGNERIDGDTPVCIATARRRTGADVTAWVSTRNGLPLQVESRDTACGEPQAVRIRYSDYNDPAIRIATPD